MEEGREVKSGPLAGLQKAPPRRAERLLAPALDNKGVSHTHKRAKAFEGLPKQKHTVIYLECTHPRQRTGACVLSDILELALSPHQGGGGLGHSTALGQVTQAPWIIVEWAL